MPSACSRRRANACVPGRLENACDASLMDTARDFTLRLQDLLRRERAALGEFLVALADFDGRRLWIELGYSSLFDFLHRELGVSKGAAFYRKTAVELIQRFPEIVEPLRDGRLCLMTVAEVARVLTPENRAQVLPRFFGLSKREAQALAAALLPVESPPRREVVTAVRVSALASTTAAGSAARVAVQPVELARPRPDTVPHVQTDAPRAEQASQPPQPPPRTEPLTAELNRFHVTVSRRFLEKLDAARAALSHSHPGAGAEEILEAGLDLVLERHARRKGLVKKPRREPPPSKPDHVPAHVRRAVWERDGGRCQWPLASGGICGSTVRLELDHVIPRARGGPSTVENLRICCQFHNDLAARRAYGNEWMNRYTRGRPARPAAEERSVNGPPP